MKKLDNNLDNLVINTLRTLSMDAVQKANSGHPGAPMAMAPVAYTLWQNHMKHSATDPQWLNRDRFVLSAGHASMLLYSLLHVMGYEISLDDIKNFRQLHSKCAGHPEFGYAPGIETTTGPLGQGLANSVGFAIAGKWLAETYNKENFELFNYKNYVIAGDGCMMEGVSSEAASLAGHLKLNNLVWLYDNNNITIDGKTDISFTEDVAARFLAYKWKVQHVTDANDLEKLNHALDAAKKEKDRPSLIIVDSHIAYGSPNMQDTSKAHGSPLGAAEIVETKAFYGWPADKQFFVPDEVKAYRESVIKSGEIIIKDWNDLFEKYSKQYPELAKQINLIKENKLPAGYESSLPEFEADKKGLAGRIASGQILNKLADEIPWIIGGAADLASSTQTVVKSSDSFEQGNYSGRNIHYGVREHAMGAIANGISLCNLRTFASTFLVFSDYMRPAIRLSAIMKQPVVYVFTHDSIGLGEDGPTHQPIEHVESLRAIPNLDVIRPADANELSVLWKHIIEQEKTPVALILTRQNVPTLDRSKYNSADNALNGGYIIADCDGLPDVILMSTGSELQICLETYEALTKDGIKVRVVSVPCFELFDKQSAEYKEKVLPSNVTTRIAVEAGSTSGWIKYTGNTQDSEVLGMHSFGASAPIADLMKEFGFTTENLIKLVREKLAKK